MLKLRCLVKSLKLEEQRRLSYLHSNEGKADDLYVVNKKAGTFTAGIYPGKT